MGLVAVTGGAVLLDDEDEWILKEGTWFVSEGRIKGYTYSPYKQERLHHYLAGFPLHDLEVDHINGNGLDNRRHNLEIVSHRENVLRWATSTRGYYWDKSRGKWMVSLTINYKRINGGRFAREEDAARRAQEIRDCANAS